MTHAARFWEQRYWNELAETCGKISRIYDICPIKRSPSSALTYMYIKKWKVLNLVVDVPFPMPPHMWSHNYYTYKLVLYQSLHLIPSNNLAMVVQSTRGLAYYTSIAGSSKACFSSTERHIHPIFQLRTISLFACCSSWCISSLELSCCLSSSILASWAFSLSPNTHDSHLDRANSA